MNINKIIITAILTLLTILPLQISYADYVEYNTTKEDLTNKFNLFNELEDHRYRDNDKDYDNNEQYKINTIENIKNVEEHLNQIAINELMNNHGHNSHNDHHGHSNNNIKDVYENESDKMNAVCNIIYKYVSFKADYVDYEEKVSEDGYKIFRLIPFYNGLVDYYEPIFEAKINHNALLLLNKYNNYDNISYIRRWAINLQDYYNKLINDKKSCEQFDF